MHSSDAASWSAPSSASAAASRSPAPTSKSSPAPDYCARSSTAAGYAPTSSSAARSSSATKSFRPTNHPLAAKSCGESRSLERAGRPLPFPQDALTALLQTGVMAMTVLRRRRPGESPRVTHVELFFDLVYVFAVTQLSH